MELLTSLINTSTFPSLTDIPANENVATDFSELLPTTENVSSVASVAMTSLNLGPVRDPLYIVIPITGLYSLIFFTGVVGNIITCIVIARNKHMQTATNYYLFSLAVSDLVLLLSGLPQEIYCIWSRYPYVFGEVFCVLRGLFAETSANATVLTITAFTMERYVAICHPFLSQTMSKLSRAVKIILIIWIVAIVLAIPQAFQFGIVMGNTPDIVMCTVKSPIFTHSFEISTLLFFILPMTLITVLYALIGLRLRHSNMIMKCAAVGSLNCKHDSHPLTTASLHRTRQRHLESGKHRKSTCCRQHQIQCSRRVIKMLVAVVVAFFICWAPFHAQRLFAIYGIGKAPAPVILKIYEIMTYISGILYYVSTTINPILYHIMSLKFRQAFTNTLACCCRSQEPKGQGTRRKYSTIFRSGHRGSLGTSTAGQDSTEYSGNSEVLLSGPGSNGSSVKDFSGTRKCIRMQERNYPAGSRGQDFNWVTPANDQNNTESNCRRSYSVVINSTHCNENCMKSVAAQDPNHQHTQFSQRSVLAKIPRKSNLIIKQNRKRSRWNIFRNLKSSAKFVEENKKLSVSYSLTPASPDHYSEPAEAVDMVPMRRTSSVNSVSNSSLRDAEVGLAATIRHER